jgi:hypothetical protein
MSMIPEDQDKIQMDHHCCECYAKELAFQREPHTENTVVVRAISACDNTGEGSLAAQSYLAAFFKREEAKLSALTLTMPKWDSK